MTGKELERLLESLTPLSERDLDARGRELRKMRMVPSGGRGLNAPEFGPEHMANFLLAVAGTDNASHAARAVMDYAPLVPSDGRYNGFAVAETFADAITEMFARPEAANSVKKIRICRSHPIAEIRWEQSGEEMRTFYVQEDAGEVNPAGIGGASMTVWAEIGPGLIKQVHIEIEDIPGEKSSWGGDG